MVSQMTRLSDAVKTRAKREGPIPARAEKVSVLFGDVTPTTLEQTISVVVPTRNEAGNIGELVRRIQEATSNSLREIIFVDDSDDDTVATIEAVRAQAKCDIVIIHREGSQRDGLAGAVVVGMSAARASWLCVLDADLQHPPELIPQLLEKAEQTGANLVAASRYSEQGTVGSFGRIRALLSQASTTAARVMFPGRLRKVNDPMSGFFLVRRDAVDLDVLRPKGFKILLEILVRTPNLRIAEVGFKFGERFAGASKASLREGLRYLTHLYHLRFGAESLRFVRFLIVGLSGLLVNTLLLAGATEAFGIFYLLSALLATQGSTLWNFLLTEFWAMSGHPRQGRLMRMALFFSMNNAALLARGPVLFALTSLLGVHYVASNIITLAGFMLVRYALADKWIWGKSKQKHGQLSMFHYNVHDIITVASEVWLPELERFLTGERAARPTIRVRIQEGKLSTSTEANANSTARRISYEERLGPLGFGMEIVMGETIEVSASPLLRRSPHVLYTNIVEPILRWTFVEKGYALVHGACIAVGKDAYLVTARTDTGKTTTILRILARQRRTTDNASFLSDDLTLVSPEGRVLPYPKPLTISFHTVKAINTAKLSRHERLTLPIQSRIHSKSGRRIAFFLAKTKLPVATVNTLVQLLVPPPKYHVNRLVPGVKFVPEAKLAGMFVIQRGGEGSVSLSGDEALETLMRNSEDAYGFPPYSTIESFLYDSSGVDLRVAEREIVATALAGWPAVLLMSNKMDWSERIAGQDHLAVEQRDRAAAAAQEAPFVERAYNPSAVSVQASSG